MKEQDVLVIGAGPSGTVAASIIHQAGFHVAIVEKEVFPRFVIGESLLPKCMEALEAAGFIEAVKAKGFQQKYGAKFVNSERKVADFNFSDQYTAGWTWTWQVKRADFDTTLAHTVEQMGVSIDFNTAVSDIQFEGTDSIVTLTDHDGTNRMIRAKFIVDASGYGRVLPRLLNLDKPSGLPSRKTLFTHIRDIRRADYVEPDRILIIDHKPGVWAWCIPFSDGITSCGFVGAPEFFDDFSGDLEAQLRSVIASEWSIAGRFEGAEFLFEPKVIQGWSTSTDRFYGPGFVLTGNVTEFLDPIFSSGVTLAVTSSHLAADLVVRELRGQKVDWEKEFTGPVAYGVDTFRSYVNAWYDGRLQKIFFADDQDPEVKRQICSVLAGYVWDTDNSYVASHQTILDRLVRLIAVGKKIKDTSN